MDCDVGKSTPVISSFAPWKRVGLARNVRVPSASAIQARPPAGGTDLLRPHRHPMTRGPSAGGPAALLAMWEGPNPLSVGPLVSPVLDSLHAPELLSV